MDYIILSAVMAVIFGIVSFSKDSKGTCLATSILMFVIWAIINIIGLPVINFTAFPDIWLEVLITSFLGLVLYYLVKDDLAFSSLLLRATPSFVSALVLIVMLGAAFIFTRQTNFAIC